MTPAQVAEAFVAHLLLQPAAVRLQINYWLAQHTPMETLMHASAVDDGARRAESPRAAFQTTVRALFAQLATVPGDLRLRGQAALLPTRSATEPRPVFVLAWAPNVLALSDELLLRAGWPRLIEALGAMCAAPERYWLHVASGDMRGHTVAELFRWPELIARLYSPATFLCAACHALLAQHEQECVAAGLVTAAAASDDAGAVTANMALRATLADAVDAAPPPPPDRPREASLRRTLAAVLRDPLRSARGAREAVAHAVANLDEDMLAHYAKLRDAVLA